MSRNRSSALKREREQRKAEKLANKRRRKEERKQEAPAEPAETGFDDESSNLPEPPLAGATSGPSQD